VSESVCVRVLIRVSSLRVASGRVYGKHLADLKNIRHRPFVAREVSARSVQMAAASCLIAIMAC
jgi:hypothetical protein